MKIKFIKGKRKTCRALLFKTALCIQSAVQKRLSFFQQKIPVYLVIKS